MFEGSSMKRGFLGQASNRVVDLSMTLWNSRKIFRPGKKQAEVEKRPGKRPLYPFPENLVHI